MTTAKELLARYRMDPHVEGGAFLELPFNRGQASQRPDSGAIYYYVAPGERAAFHCVDCDEYWCFTAGDPMEIWQISPDGALCVSRLGTSEACEPVVPVKRGTIFAARHTAANDDGSFIVCITAPQFTYEGFRLVNKDDVLALCPSAQAFFEAPIE